MDWYLYIAILLIMSQAVFWIQIHNNYRYALNKYKKHRGHRPRTVLIIPCKGLDTNFDKNIASFFHQEYENYLLWFVVGDKDDPAYNKLCELKNSLSQTSMAKEIKIWIAGPAKSCSQKIHNLLHCYNQITSDIEVLAFADSDICVRTDWLSHLVYPLRQPIRGCSSGYRWYVPKTNNLATIALSAINGKIAQLLGNSMFNQVWGGSMAINVETFRKLGIDKIWQKTISDDLSISYAVKKARLRVAFIPACLVASYESTTWRELFKFGRRQFLITRVSMPRTWWFALFSSLYSTLGLWGTTAIAVYAHCAGVKYASFYAVVPIIFFAAQMSRAIVRQRLIAKLLEKDAPHLKVVKFADIAFFWLWSLIMLIMVLSSAFGRTIVWRNIKYKLISPTETIVVKHK